MRSRAVSLLASLMATHLLVSAIPAMGQAPKLELENAECLRHFEIGDTIGEGESAGQMIGYFDRVIHHTGLRNRHYVFAVKDMPDRVVTVRGGKLTAQIVNTSDDEMLKKFFIRSRVLDQTDLSRPELAGVAIMAPPAELTKWGCRL